MRLSLLEQSYMEGFKEGFTESLQERHILTDQDVLTDQEYIMYLLEARFGNIPDSFQTKLDAIDDKEVLDFLYFVAIKSSFLEDFEQKLQQYENSVEHVAQNV